MDNGDDSEKEVLIVHNDNGHIHKRRSRFSAGILSLRKAILECYSDILIPKIASITGMRQTDVKDAANQERVKSLLYITVYNEKFEEKIEVFEENDVEDGDRIFVDIIDKAKAKSNINTSHVEPEGTYDIALEIKSMKLHLHVSEEGDHKFFPYWCNFRKMEKANGLFPPGIYRIWCPVYSNGQGYISIGEPDPYHPELFQINISGYTEILADFSSTDLRFEANDENTRIIFQKENAYLGYDCETGKVFAACDPKKMTHFNFDFKIKELSSDYGYGMYYQIFNASGENSNGKSRLLQVTKENTLVRVDEVVDVQYKDPATLFTIYRKTAG